MIPVMMVAGGRRRVSVVSDPTLVMDYDFTAMSSLPAEWTFTGTSGGSYTDVNGSTQTVGANTPRFDYHPTTHAPLGLLLGGQSELATVSLSGTTFSTTTGTIVLDFMHSSGSGALGRIISVDNNLAGGTERLAAFYYDLTYNTRSQYRPAGSTQYAENTSGGAVNAHQIVALAYAAGNGATYGNGVTGTPVTSTGASVTVPLSATMVRIGNSINGDRPYVGWVRRVRIFNDRKSNANLATLTTVP